MIPIFLYGYDLLTYFVTGVLIVLALFTLTPLFYYIPKSALSAVIIFSVIQMVDVMVVKKLWKTNSKFTGFKSVLSSDVF